MASQHIGSALFLIAATVAIHGTGAVVISWVLFHVRGHAKRLFGFVHNTFVLTLLIVALMTVHLMEVVCWAGFYLHQKCFSDFSTSLYFSLASYTTVGYGDVVLRDPEWRLLGGVEALTGSLMLCWSTVILVQVLTKASALRMGAWEAEEAHARGRMHRPEPWRKAS